MLRAFRLLAVIGLGIFVMQSHAVDLRFNGFMSVGAGTTLDDDTTYLIDKANGGEYDDSLSFKPDTLFGLQVTADLMDDLSATAQLVSRGVADFDTKVEWAYFSYNATNNLTLQGGRLRLPLYYYSDFLDVGYAYHWVRPPQQYYNVVVNNYEGINALWRTNVGNVDFLTQVYGGRVKEFIPALFGGIYNNGEGLLGLTFTTSWNWLEVRLGYSTLEVDAPDLTKLGLSYNAYVGVLQGATGFPLPVAQAIANQDVGIDYYSAAVKVDWNNWLFVAEGYQEEHDKPSGLHERQSWYASVGYRIGAFTPHITFAELNNDRSKLDELAGFPVVDPGNPADHEQAWTYGVRWDFHSSAALKVEFTDIENREQAPGVSDDTQVISAAIDVVF